MSNYDFMTPVIIVVIYLVIYIFRKKIYDYIKRIEVKHKIISFYLKFYSVGVYLTCRIKINNWKKSILLPLLIVIVMNVVIYSFLKMTNPSFNIWEKLASTFIAPISEELIFRGGFLGFVSIYFPEELFKKRKWNYSKELKWSIIFAGIMLSSLYFASQHQQPAILQFFWSIIFSLLYLYNDRNLTAPITVHLLNNLIANFIL
jgi:membrane protease YdiL (CAAX protease family)